MPIMIFMTRYLHSSSFSSRLNSGSKRLFLFSQLIFILFSILFVSSCEVGPSKIGTELLPGSDFVSVNSTDTLSAWSYTMFESSVPSSSPSYAILGNVIDPYFGSTTAEFVSELRLSGEWNYGPVTLDSVKLNLTFLTVKGGSNQGRHVLRMAEIKDQIFTDKIYNSDRVADTTDFMISTELPALTADTINKISVSLPIAFGEYLVRDTSKLFYSNTKPDFRAFFKGLAFRMSSTVDPLMVTFGLTSEVSSGGYYNNYISVYMHDTANLLKEYMFILDPVHKNAAYNKFTHDFSWADPQKKIQHLNDITTRDTFSYVQYLDGAYTKIVFPGLDSLRKLFSKGKYSINKARLTVPVYYDQNVYTSSTVPSSLRIRYVDKGGDKFDVPDYNVDDYHTFFDGSLNKKDSLYKFNIATYIQGFLDDKAGEFKPELEIFQGTYDVSNAILKTNKSKMPVKFELTYSKF